MSSLGLKGSTQSLKAHERDRQFGVNEMIDIAMCLRLPKEGNDRINPVSAMRAVLAKIVEKVHISTYFECAATNHQIEENACYIDYADTRSSKQVH